MRVVDYGFRLRFAWGVWWASAILAIFFSALLAVFLGAYPAEGNLGIWLLPFVGLVLVIWVSTPLVVASVLYAKGLSESVWLIGLSMVGGVPLAFRVLAAVMPYGAGIGVGLLWLGMMVWAAVTLVHVGRRRRSAEACLPVE